MTDSLIINILVGAVSVLLTIFLGMMAWFLNKVWTRADDSDLRAEKHEERTAKIEAMLATLTEIGKRQEEFQEKVLTRLLEKGL
jgi:flagellar basal body-associated protein FliL